MTAPLPDAVRPTARDRVLHHARHVSPLSWKVLAAFVVVGVAGVAVYIAGAVNRPAVRGTGPVSPSHASGLLGGGETPVDTPARSAADDSWTAWSGAKGAALGFGFVGGFVVGFVFRAFLKLMALVTVVIVGGLGLLSYYHVLNIDFTAAKHAYESNAQWLTDQAMRLKDVLLAHLPSGGGGAAGAYFGLRRR